MTLFTMIILQKTLSAGSTGKSKAWTRQISGEGGQWGSELLPGLGRLGKGEGLQPHQWETQVRYKCTGRLFL